jgi:hypothetical protein
MWCDQVWLHGDATPANFLLVSMDVAAIDLEPCWGAGCSMSGGRRQLNAFMPC